MRKEKTTPLLPPEGRGQVKRHVYCLHAIPTVLLNGIVGRSSGRSPLVATISGVADKEGP